MMTPSQTAKFVFGPVPSRRLGRSLGVDVVPFKTCTYDCIYCQLGHTTRKTIERKEWVPMDAVLEDLKSKLSCRPDYITLSGSGEPTLHSRLGELIDHIKAMTTAPVAVLTNGSLLWQKAVREELALADLVLPSLDAPDPERFQFINRPHSNITFERLIEGLTAFRADFHGRYWLEVLLLHGYTSLPPQVRQIAGWVRRIRPDRVQLNTAVRPPAEEYAMAVPAKSLRELATLFDPPAEVIAEYRASPVPYGSADPTRAILALLRRRPCTMKDIADGIGIKPGEAVKLIAGLEARSLVQHTRRGSEFFYQSLAPQPPCTRRVAS